MNVNLTNVSATSKASVSESGAKTSAEGSESKGFLETLAGVFTVSQKNQASLANPVIQANEVEDSSSVQFMQSQGESQETVTVEGKNENQSTDALLAKESDQETSDDQVVALVKQDSETESKAEAAKNSAEVESTADSDHDASETMISKSDQQDAKSDKADAHDVKRSMDEGQQLLGRIEQAQQTLKPHSQDANSGKGLPPQIVGGFSNTYDTNNKSIKSSDEVELGGKATGFAPAESGSELPEWQPQYVQELQTESGLEQHGEEIEGIAQVTNILRDVSDDFDSKLVQRISIEDIEEIDTKLAQGKPLTSHEVEIIEELKSGTLVADLTEQTFAQLAALPDEVKVVLSESLTTQHSAMRQTSEAAMTQQSQQVVTPDVKQPTVADKAALPVTPEALATASLNPAMQQVVVNTEVGNKAMNAALVAGSLKTTVLKTTTDKHDTTEPQQGLAGQLQAAVNQQGVTTPQQARAVDAAQQAQLPLQLTKELANDQVAEKVQMMMSKNLKNLDIRLDPPELGRMQIRMTMNSDLTNVHFTVTNPQAREIIEQTLPRLREMLAQQGMQLAESSVQQQSSGQQQSGYAATEQNRQGTVGRGFSSGQSDDNVDADIELNVKVTSPRDGISFYA
ncbi:flagellar hook-length control protein FliK [Vibrio sp. YIC-376]|uniref:flagellar hook-length control protein FliK n=1 Tax=Vibrio sp. YIC-376 TaxID=3136162 RepID=UPI00402ABABB